MSEAYLFVICTTSSMSTSKSPSTSPGIVTVARAREDAPNSPKDRKKEGIVLRTSLSVMACAKNYVENVDYTVAIQISVQVVSRVTILNRVNARNLHYI